jgi:deoxyribonucleoside regulator
MARPSELINTRLISKVSLLYYNLDLTQQQIAKRLNLSRPKVSRLLKQARELGIVKITVEAAEGKYLDEETDLENKFGLKEAIIVEPEFADATMSPKALKFQLGKAGARYLQRTISDNEIIGMTWGTTLSTMIETMAPIPTKDVHAVQLLGGVGPPEAKEHSIDITRRLAHLLNASVTLLQAPGIVNSPETKKVLLADKRVSEALNLFSKINTAYVGIGALTTNPVLQKESPEISAQIQNEIINSKAVGDISLNFFDINGNPVETHFKDLFIGISLEELKQIDTVVGVAGGDDKFEAILGALNGKFINVLVTDKKTAFKLLNIEN